MLAEVIPWGIIVVRVHHEADGPLWFGPQPGTPPQHRFDASNGEYRILYCAARLAGAFVELVFRRPGRIVARAYAEEWVWSNLTVRRMLRLANLRDEGLHWRGTDAAISASDNYAAPRRLALALHAAFPDIDGLAYRASHNNGEVCYVLFDRVAAADLVPGASQRLAEDPEVVDQLMARRAV